MYLIVQIPHLIVVMGQRHIFNGINDVGNSYVRVLLEEEPKGVVVATGSRQGQVEDINHSLSRHLLGLLILESHLTKIVRPWITLPILNSCNCNPL